MKQISALPPSEMKPLLPAVFHAVICMAVDYGKPKPAPQPQPPAPPTVEAITEVVADVPTRKCRKCGQAKPLELFNLIHGKGRPEKDRICAECRAEAVRQRTRKPKAATASKPQTVGKHTCSYCGETKPLDAFGIKARSGKPMSECKACIAANYRAERAAAKAEAERLKQTPKPSKPKPKAAPYIGQIAPSPYASNMQLHKGPRADGRLCAINELELRGPVLRPGSASPAIEQAMRTFGSR